MKGITTFVVLVAMFSVGLLISVAVMDPLSQIILGYNLGGMGGQVSNIHVAAVKYIVPVGLGTFLLWCVLYILRRERNTIR